MRNSHTREYLGQATDEQLLEGLIAVRNQEKYRIPEKGICVCLERWFEGQGCELDPNDEHHLRALMSKWPKFSGKVFYPVPSAEPELDAYDAYHECMNHWDRDTPYGQLRWELLEFCIATLESQ